MYDAIIVGSRCAGASTALLLARTGRRVLVLDRATFPSDVLSGHTIQPAGVAHLARWDLLDEVRATGVPFAGRVRFDFGDVVLDGSPEPVDGLDAAVCIRRTVFDTLLTRAAERAGAEVRLGTSVTELIFDGGRVVGVRGHDGDGRPVEERSRIVVGADGVNSFVARHVGAPTLRSVPATTVSVYSYWEDTGLDHVSIAVRPGAFFVAAPTNDGLTFLAQEVPLRKAPSYRSRVGELFDEVLAGAPHLVDLIAGTRRAERFRFAPTPDAHLRRSSGAGWALVGDAGHHKDPITAQGMTDAFRDAELLASVLEQHLDGPPETLDLALARAYERRQAEAVPMFEHTCALADLEAPPPPEMQHLLAALESRPRDVSRFLGVIAGSVPVPDFFDPVNLAALVAA